MKNKSLILVAALLLVPGLSHAKKQKEFTFEKRAPKAQAKKQKVLELDWTTRLKPGSPKKRFYPETSEPVLHEGIVYVGTHGQIFYAVNAADGEIVWQYDHNEGIAGKAAVTDEGVYFVDLNGQLILLDKNSGEYLASYDFHKEVLSTPLAKGNRVYLLAGEKEVVCLDKALSKQIWRTPIKTYVKDLTMRGQGDLVWHAGNLYVGLADGRVYALSSSGKVLWSKGYAPPLQTFKDIDAHLVFSGDSFFVAGYFGAVHRVNQRSKSVLWSTDVGAGVAPYVDDQQVLVADTRGGLSLYSRKDGFLRWSHELNKSILSQPVVIDEHFFVASFDQKAFVLEPTTGQVVQTMKLPEGSMNAPVVTEDRVILLTNSGRLVALKLASKE